MYWDLEERKIPLKFTWKIARGSSQQKTLFFVKVKSAEHEGIGEAAFLTKEYNFELIYQQFSQFQKHWDDTFQIQELHKICKQTSMASPLSFALSSAYTHLMAKQKGISVSQYLGQNVVTSVTTSFSLPIMGPVELEKFYQKFQLERFASLKIKVNRDNCKESTKHLLKLYPGKIRIDGNEAWEDPEQLLKDLSHIKKERIEFLEQPLKSQLHEELLYLKQHSPYLLVADESLIDLDVTNYHQERFHGVNIKLMKAGSYNRALMQMQQAKQLGLKVMLGCMVESGLGIWSALQIADQADYFDLDGFLFLTENPYPLVCEIDGKIRTC